MYHEAYHQEAQRRQRVIERKHLALERLKEKYTRQVSLNFTLRFRGLVILFIVKSEIFFLSLKTTQGMPFYLAEMLFCLPDLVLNVTQQQTKFILKCQCLPNPNKAEK